MSLPYPLLPDLPGWDITRDRVTQWATITQVSPSGMEQRASYRSSPRWAYSLTANLLRGQRRLLAGQLSEVVMLCNFFDQQQGSLKPFLLRDAISGGVSQYAFATAATGRVNNFQVLDGEGKNAAYISSYSFDQYISGAWSTISPSLYSLNTTTGVLTLNTNAIIGTIFRWTGVSNKLVRFSSDELSITQALDQVFTGKSFEMISLKN